MDILNGAKALAPTLVSWRRTLHARPEIGFDLPRTREFLLGELKGMGYHPQEIGKGSIVAEIGPKTDGTVLLRADMDGLAVGEETDLSFRSENGKMHACGHDLHAAMLLGAAMLLKEKESSLRRRVRLLFQAAEETLQGAEDARSFGVCDGVCAAYMLHVTVNTNLPAGTVIVPPAGIIAPSADFFEISVKGRGCHGADPAAGIDPLSVAARILLGLQNLPSREFPSGALGALTVGSLRGGDCFNVIPDTARLQGSLRCYGEDLRAFLKTRVKEIASFTADGFRASAAVSFPVGCPSLKNDEALRNSLPAVLEHVLGKEGVLVANTPSGTAGSEDFAVISHAVPSVMLALAAGNPGVPLHHPKIVFDENALPYGTAALAALAMQ
ncbi:MAG: amidohydrolase [Clostridia bacterium]|nr:amidohydrolase [Clostridia bacterium]